MSVLSEMFDDNEVLKVYPRFLGTSGNLDFLEIFKNKDIKIGVKFALEQSFGTGTIIVCRVRIVGSGEKDIFNVAKYMESTFGKELLQAEMIGHVKSDSERCSVAFHGDKPLEHLGKNLAIDWVSINKGFNIMWRDVTKKASKIIGLLTKNDKTSMGDVMKISQALGMIYGPKKPDVSEGSDTVVKGDFGKKKKGKLPKKDVVPVDPKADEEIILSDSNKHPNDPDAAAANALAQAAIDEDEESPSKEDK